MQGGECYQRLIRVTKINTLFAVLTDILGKQDPVMLKLPFRNQTKRQKYYIK